MWLQNLKNTHSSHSFNSLFLVKLRPEIEILKLKFELTLSASSATQQLCVSLGERIPKVWKVDASRLQKEEKGGGSKVVDRCRRSERKFFFCGRCNRLHPRILFLSTLPVFIRIHIWRTPLSRAGRPTSRRRLDRVTWRSNLCRME